MNGKQKKEIEKKEGVLKVIMRNHDHWKDSKNWVKVNNLFTARLGCSASVLLSTAIAAEGYVLTKKIESLWKLDGFFIFENNYIEKVLGMNAYEVRKSLKILTDNKLVEVKRDGYKNRRIIRINWDKINSTFDEWNFFRITLDNEKFYKEMVDLED